MKQLAGYLGAALLILLGARVQRPQEHPEPQPEPVVAAVAAPSQPVMPEVVNGDDPNKPPTPAGQGG